MSEDGEDGGENQSGENTDENKQDVEARWFGPSFTISRDEETNKPKMVWDEGRRRDQPTHCHEMLKFCVDEVLKLTKRYPTIRVDIYPLYDGIDCRPSFGL